MTKDEFLKMMKSLDITLYTKVEKRNRYDYYGRTGYKPEYFRKPRKNAKDPKPEPTLEQLYLYTEWTSGGQTGGSCWDEGDSHYYPIDSDPEPDTDLDFVLEKICPQITFLQYKALVHGLEERDSYSVNEYYGNYTTYGIKTINLSVLYDALKDKGLLE